VAWPGRFDGCDGKGSSGVRWPVNGQFLVPAGGQVKVAILRCCFSDW
jgi:hypothetical protein